MRIILFTGKGGVGKTSVAAATALRSAELGYKTIVISTDAAHSLADSFDTPLSAQPVKVAKNLWAQEIDALEEMERNWGLVQEWMSQVLAWKGYDNVIADELTVFPGMEEVFSLLQIKRHYKAGKYDLIIIDCAPTGESLKLLSFPEITRWWLEKVFPLERTVAKVVRPVLQPFVEFPMPSDEIFGSVEHLFKSLDGMQDIMANPKSSTVRLVINPEKMVIKEAQRGFTTLNLFGYNTDAVIVNRLIPKEVSEGFFSAWKESQSKYYQLIEECFSPLPILTIPLFGQEVVGKKMLNLMAQALYQDRNPVEVMFKGNAQKVSKEDGAYILTLMLPFVSKENISLTQKGDELIIKVGGYKREILLPRVLHGLETAGAKINQNQLLIKFKEGKQ